MTSAAAVAEVVSGAFFSDMVLYSAAAEVEKGT